MINIFRWIKIVFRIIILFVALPFMLIYLLVKQSLFKSIFKRQLSSIGVDKYAIDSLSKELNLLSVLKFVAK